MLVRHLREHGHWVKDDLSLEEVWALYRNVRSRRIRVRPRATCRSRELAARVLTPLEAQVIAAIESLSVAGGDLNAFLHRRLRVEPAFEDHSLATSGLHHLHLGSAAPQRKTGLTKRSRDVLFAFATDDVLHLVDVRPHGRKARLETKRARRLRGEPPAIDPVREWTLDEGLVEIASSNWPDAFASSRAARAALSFPAPSASGVPRFEGFEVVAWDPIE